MAQNIERHEDKVAEQVKKAVTASGITEHLSRVISDIARAALEVNA